MKTEEERALDRAKASFDKDTKLRRKILKHNHRGGISKVNKLLKIMRKKNDK